MRTTISQAHTSAFQPTNCKLKLKLPVPMHCNAYTTLDCRLKRHGYFFRSGTIAPVQMAVRPSCRHCPRWTTQCFDNTVIFALATSCEHHIHQWICRPSLLCLSSAREISGANVKCPAVMLLSPYKGLAKARFPWFPRDVFAVCFVLHDASSGRIKQTRL